MAYNKINFEDYPSTRTPLDANNLNHLEEGIFNNDKRLNELPEVKVTQVVSEGTKIATIEVGEKSTAIYAPSGGGGSNVEVNPIVTTGTKIATITVDGNESELYTPNSGGGSEDVIITKAEYDALPDTKLTDGKHYFLKDYSEGGEGGGSTVEVTPILTTGTKIATITVDGEDTDLYAPNGGGHTTPIEPVEYDLTDYLVADVWKSKNTVRAIKYGNIVVVHLEGRIVANANVITRIIDTLPDELIPNSLQDLSMMNFSNSVCRAFVSNVIHVFTTTAFSGSSGVEINIHGCYIAKDNTGGFVVSNVGGIDYSTEEQDTGLKWIDGKTIYQKTVDMTINIPVGESHFTLDEIDAEYLVDFHCHNAVMNANRYNGYGSGMWADVADNKILIANAESVNPRNNYRVIFTVKYTKP